MQYINCKYRLYKYITVRISISNTYPFIIYSTMNLFWWQLLSVFVVFCWVYSRVNQPGKIWAMASCMTKLCGTPRLIHPRVQHMVHLKMISPPPPHRKKKSGRFFFRNPFISSFQAVFTWGLRKPSKLLRTQDSDECFWTSTSNTLEI